MFFYEFFLMYFFIIFESFIDLRKSRCDVLNGTTQRWACSTLHINLYKIANIGKNILQNNNFMRK
jgi:hypothetical protein